jgi:hypothetical protein
VQIKATDSAERLPKKIGDLTRDLMRGQHSFYRDVPFPVCLFLFAVDTGEASYAWLVEPVCGESAELQVIANAGHTFSGLNDAAVDRIVETVRRWYELQERRRKVLRR